MNSDEIKTRLTKVFRDIFDTPALELRDDMTADDIEDWDSLTHVDLIVEVEKEFKIKLSTGEVRKMKNVGDFITLIGSKVS
jgi:acyl carrier protein